MKNKFTFMYKKLLEVRAFVIYKMFGVKFNILKMKYIPLNLSEMISS